MWKPLRLFAVSLGLLAPVNAQTQVDDYIVEWPSETTIRAAEASTLVYSLSENQNFRLVHSRNAKIGALQADYADGFKAAVYKDNGGRYYLTFAGTDFFSLGPSFAKDATVDTAFVGRLGGPQDPPAILAQSQLQSALSFALAAKVSLERQGVNPADVIVAGHSSGGGLAQIVGTTIFAGSQTQTFSAPGVSSFLRLVENDTKNPLRPILAQRNDAAAIVNNIRIGDPVPRYGGAHIGRVVAYDNPIEAPKVPVDAKSDFAKHSIRQFSADLKAGMKGVAVTSNAQLVRLTTAGKEKLEKINPVRQKARKEVGLKDEYEFDHENCSATFSGPTIRGNQLDVSGMFKMDCK